MTPNKKLRHKIYKQALISFVSNPAFGLCFEIYRAVEHLELFISDDIEDYPELFKHKPEGKRDDEYWWDTVFTQSQMKRIAVLEQAIHETSKSGWKGKKFWKELENDMAFNIRSRWEKRNEVTI